MNDAFVFVAQAITDREIRFDPPLVLRENSEVSIALGRSREKVLSETAGRVGEKVSGAVKVPGARRVLEIDKG